ncbi:MAG: glycosyltransferase family 2 protein [Candidatus Hinthialibacter antarcticus]|nr:glycosyltransferase family 2 protein [Candidatus Hinthialibacter antarcticus]
MSDTKRGYSIVIPVYNGAKTLPDTLISVMQLEGAAFEVIIVDDASTDNTAQLALDAGARVVTLEQNSGPATARNKGAAESKYDVIVFTDSDVLVPKALLQKLDQHFQQSNAECVQGVFSNVCPFANFCSQYKNLYNRFVLTQLPDWIDTTYTSLTAVKKDAFMQCGGFDENIRDASVEDRTLGRNLIRSNFRIWLARDIEVLHNKKLTAWGFIRNQYRRSRDLAKLLLRNRAEKQQEPSPSTAERGRFGTNSLAAMLRIPLIYLIAAASVWMGCSGNMNWLLVIAPLLVLYAYLIDGYMKYLFRHRGIVFTLKGAFLNIIDAFTSGLGIAVGIMSFMLFGKKY